MSWQCGARTRKLLEHVARGEAALLAGVVRVAPQLVERLEHLAVHYLRRHVAAVAHQAAHDLRSAHRTR